MPLRERLLTSNGAPPAHAIQRKSFLRSRAIVAIVVVVFALPAYCLAANSGDENRAAHSSANLADNTATDDTSADNAAHNTAVNTTIANEPAVAHPLALNSEIYPDDEEPPVVSAPVALAPGTLESVGALPLVGFAGEPAPARRCFLVVPGLCAAAKNKPIVALATMQAAALIADGVTTRQYVKRGYIEVDPLTRILIGRKPTWARMAPLGTLQVFAGMWLAERMETSRHGWIRRLWWLPQLVGISGNAAATANNLTLH